MDKYFTAEQIMKTRRHTWLFDSEQGRSQDNPNIAKRIALKTIENLKELRRKFIRMSAPYKAIYVTEKLLQLLNDFCLAKKTYDEFELLRYFNSLDRMKGNIHTETSGSKQTVNNSYAKTAAFNTLYNLVIFRIRRFIIKAGAENVRRWLRKRAAEKKKSDGYGA